MPFTLLRAFDKFIQISCLAFKEVLTNAMGVLCNIRLYANNVPLGMMNSCFMVLTKYSPLLVSVFGHTACVVVHVNSGTVKLICYEHILCTRR